MSHHVTLCIYIYHMVSYPHHIPIIHCHTMVDHQAKWTLLSWRSGRGDAIAPGLAVDHTALSANDGSAVHDLPLPG